MITSKNTKKKCISNFDCIIGNCIFDMLIRVEILEEK